MTDDAATAARLRTSLRLKAARWLAGREHDGRAVPLSVADLAKHPLMRENGITKNRLEDYEQMEADPRPMELRIIAEALGVRAEFLLGGEPSNPTLDEVLAILRDMQAKVEARYDELGEVVRQRAETERRLRHMSVEEADEVIRLLQEARMRQGRDVGRRSLPAAHDERHRAGPGASAA